MVNRFWRWLVATRVARMTPETLPLQLIKIGGRVRERFDCVRLRFATNHPNEHWWSALASLLHRS